MSGLDHNRRELMRVENLRVSFDAPQGSKIAVRDVSFSISAGRCLAIVGESGSGKSVTARSLVGLAGKNSIVTANRLELAGESVLGLSERRWQKHRGKSIGFILQDALVSLDQLRLVGKEIVEGPVVHGEGGDRTALKEFAVDLLTKVAVPEPEIKVRQLPYELSGGQRQRALIASSLALDPEILIADEPTTALDVTVQARILSLLGEMVQRGKALILISHDLAVVSRLADEVIVMRHGEVVERGAAREIFTNPQHEYTRTLLAAIPSASSKGRGLSKNATISRDNRISKRRIEPGILLEAHGLVKKFRGPDRVERTVVNDISFNLNSAEVLGVVGESGSGKSTLARMVMALEAPNSGYVNLKGQPWSELTESQRRPLRKNISMIYQDPLSSFDPRWTVEQIINDALLESNSEARAFRAAELLDLVGLGKTLYASRPLELSGGQRQRVAIARAIAPDPSIIVCDEPVSALDVSIQAQVLDLLGHLKDHLGISYLFISHDIGVIHHLSDRVLVMSNGVLVEQGASDDVLLRPEEAYTRKLVSSVPTLKYGKIQTKAVGADYF